MSKKSLKIKTDDDFFTKVDKTCKSSCGSVNYTHDKNEAIVNLLDLISDTLFEYESDFDTPLYTLAYMDIQKWSYVLAKVFAYEL